MKYIIIPLLLFSNLLAAQNTDAKRGTIKVKKNTYGVFVAPAVMLTRGLQILVDEKTAVITLHNLQKATLLHAYISNNKHQAPLQVKSYELVVTRNKKVIERLNAEGNNFTPTIKKIFLKAEFGDIIEFKNVIVKDLQHKELKPVNYAYLVIKEASSIDAVIELN